MNRTLKSVHKSLFREPKESIGKPWTYSAETMHKLEQEKSTVMPARVDFHAKRKEKPFADKGPRNGKYQANVSSERSLPPEYVAPKTAIARKRKLPKLVIEASTKIHTFGKKARLLKRLKKERFKI